MKTMRWWASGCVACIGMLLFGLPTMALSPVYRPRVQHPSDDPLPSNVVFRVWDHWDQNDLTLHNLDVEEIPKWNNLFRGAHALRDFAAKEVQTQVSNVPRHYYRPVFVTRETLFKVRPLQPLPQGFYVLHSKRQSYGYLKSPLFFIRSELDLIPPLPPKGLTSAIHSVRLPAIWGAGERVARNHFLALSLEPEVTPRKSHVSHELVFDALLYDVVVTPLVNGIRQPSRAKQITEMRLRTGAGQFFSETADPQGAGLLIPLDAFDAVQPTDTALEVEVRAVDLADNRSEPATIVLQDISAIQNLIARQRTSSLFNDVSTTHWAFHAVQSVAQHYILLGNNTGRFDGQASVTRYQLATVLARIFVADKPSFFAPRGTAARQVAPEPTSQPLELSFPDVSSGHWAYYDIQQLAQLGILKGGYADKFNGTQPATRAELVMALSRALQGLYANQPPGSWSTPPRNLEVASAFSDQAPGWATDAVKYAVASGIVEGYASGDFRANSSLTRFELAAMLARFLRRPCAGC